jgi:hypothetical protein
MTTNIIYLSESIREKNMFPLLFSDARYASIAAEDRAGSLPRTNIVVIGSMVAKDGVHSEPPSNVKASTNRPQTAAEVQMRHWP